MRILSDLHEKYRLSKFKDGVDKVKSVIVNSRVGRFFTKNDRKAWLYLAPTLILLAMFTFYPLINTVKMAFLEDYHYIKQTHNGFGFGNFISVLQHQRFKDAMINTAIIVFISVPLTIIISLVIAVALNSIKPFQKLFQVIFFIPYVTNVIAIGLVFSLLFHVDYGLVNSFLEFIGIGDPADPTFWVDATRAGVWHGRVVIIAYTVWTGLAFKILIFMSGLQNIGKQYYDAAKIDQASKVTVFRRITVPLLSPMIAYVAITSFIGAFKSYVEIVAIFGDSPAARNKWGTIVWYVYDNLSEPSRIGYAAAAAVILFVIILIFTAINLYVSKKKVHF